MALRVVVLGAGFGGLELSTMLYLFGDADPVFPVQPFRDEVPLLQAIGTDITFRSYPQGGHGLSDIDFWDDVADWLGAAGIRPPLG